MKTKFKTLTAVSALLMAGGMVGAQENAAQDGEAFQVETRLSDYTRPSTFTPTQAVPVNGAITENIITTTQRILNAEAPFLKTGIVSPVGEGQSRAWEITSDEGSAEHGHTAPNPLTYFAAGIASSLLTQAERGAQVLDMDIENAKVEVKVFFRYTDTMSGEWSGYTDKVIANVIIDSAESPERVAQLKQLALQAWAVGEGLANETTIDAAIIVNGDDWAGQTPRAGSVPSPISVDNGFTITNVTPDLELQTVEVEADLAMDMGRLPNPMTFTEIGIAESANDPERPFMHRIRAKSLTSNYETWELFSDDSRGYAGIAKAPTSWDYFTIGTSFCLMSQMVPNLMYSKSQGVAIDDFRVEHQFDYRQENFMTPAATGYLDDVVTRVVVATEAGEQAALDFGARSLRMCFAGEGIQNETEMETGFYLNGEVVE